MFYTLSSYSAGSYEAYWKDVLVLEEVAEAVAAELNADLGASTVDAGTLAQVLKDVVLPADPSGAAEPDAAEATGGLGALRAMSTETVGEAARVLADRLLDPVQGEAMAASAAEAAQGGVSGLSVAMAVAVVETLGAGAENAAPSRPSQDEAPQAAAIERLEAASAQAWSQFGDAATQADADALTRSAQTMVTVSKALELLHTGVVDTAPMATAPAAPHAAPSVIPAPTPTPVPALWLAPLPAPLPAAPLPAPASPATSTEPAAPAPSTPAKRFIWVVKQVLAWRWRERLVTVVRESAPAHQALDDRKQQETEHSTEDRRHRRRLELQALSHRASLPEAGTTAWPPPRGPA